MNRLFLCLFILSNILACQKEIKIIQNFDYEESFASDTFNSRRYVLPNKKDIIITEKGTIFYLKIDSNFIQYLYVEDSKIESFFDYEEYMLVLLSAKNGKELLRTSIGSDFSFSIEGKYLVTFPVRDYDKRVRKRVKIYNIGTSKFSSFVFFDSDSTSLKNIVFLNDKIFGSFTDFNDQLVRVHLSDLKDMKKTKVVFDINSNILYKNQYLKIKTDIKKEAVAILSPENIFVAFFGSKSEKLVKFLNYADTDTIIYHSKTTLNKCCNLCKEINKKSKTVDF